MLFLIDFENEILSDGERRLKFISCIHISFVGKIAMWMLAEYEGSIYIREMTEVNIEIV